MVDIQDNSSIPNEDDLDLLRRKQYIIKKMPKLAAEMKALEKKISENALLVRGFPPGLNVKNIISDWRQYSQEGVLNTEFNPPKEYTMTSEERTAYNNGGFWSSSNSTYTVHIQQYKPKYGPSSALAGTVFALATGQKDQIEIPRSVLPYWQLVNELNTKSGSYWRMSEKLKRYNKVLRGKDFSMTNADGTLSLTPFLGLVYNVGSVNEAYLSNNPNFIEELTTLSQSNSPSAITNASQLWANGKTNKGMIQPYTKLSEQMKLTTVDLPNSQSGVSYSTKRLPPTAFQFLYNPASVDMQYNGMLGVDPNFEASGLDKFNPLGVYSQSTISFNILINRMFDMKYYDRTTGVLAEQYQNTNLYKPRQPELDEQKDIYKKGTMYDVEHLLRAVLGFGMSVYLGRNMSDGQTADIGFITGIPVELHLGSNLRYLGNVTQLGITHVLFDERMVPIFTNLSISFHRLIDPADKPNIGRPIWNPDGSTVYPDESERPWANRTP